MYRVSPRLVACPKGHGSCPSAVGENAKLISVISGSDGPSQKLIKREVFISHLRYGEVTENRRVVGDGSN